jgi:hypothetical protein
LPATVARIVLGRWLKGLREHAGLSTVGQKAFLGDLATATRRWRKLYPESLPDRVKEYLDLEAHAIRIDWYASQRVPDLLCTKEHVAAELMELHHLRQGLLGRSEPVVTVRVVLDEVVLPAEEVMPEFSNVSVRVLLDEHDVHTGRHTGPFVVLGFPEVPGAGALPGVVYRGVGEVAASGPCEVALFRLSLMMSSGERRGRGSWGG